MERARLAGSCHKKCRWSVKHRGNFPPAGESAVADGIESGGCHDSIGRGQRELIIGDRQTGKTAIAIDTIIVNVKIIWQASLCIASTLPLVRALRLLLS